MLFELQQGLFIHYTNQICDQSFHKWQKDNGTDSSMKYQTFGRTRLQNRFDFRRNDVNLSEILYKLLALIIDVWFVFGGEISLDIIL